MKLDIYIASRLHPGAVILMNIYIQIPEPALYSWTFTSQSALTKPFINSPTPSLLRRLLWLVQFPEFTVLVWCSMTHLSDPGERVFFRSIFCPYVQQLFCLTHTTIQDHILLSGLRNMDDESGHSLEKHIDTKCNHYPLSFCFARNLLLRSQKPNFV